MTISNNELTLGEKFAKFVIETDFDNIPESAVARAKSVVFDFAGITLAGYGTRHPLIKSLLGYARAKAAKEEATILGAGIRTSAEDAAFSNSVLSNFLDSSDGHYMGGHINDRVVPVALSVAESVGASGKDFLTAVVLGYEAYIRLAYVLFRTAEAASTKRSPLFVVLSTLSGVAPAGKLLGLTTEQMAGAMGLAASAQIVSSQYTISGGNEKDFVCGQESRRAVMATFLAKHGILGSKDILEGKRAVGRVISESCNWDEFLEDLGTPQGFKIEEGYFKPWPACKFLHSTIEAAMNLVRDEQVKEQDIDEVIIKLNSDSARRSAFKFYSHVNAIFSHPYQAVTVLVDGKPDLPIKWPEKLQNPRITQLLERTKVEVNDEFEKMYFKKTIEGGTWPATVGVKLKDGRYLESTVMSPKGDPTVPMSDEDLKIKIANLSQGVLDRNLIEMIYKAVQNLDQVEDIGSFAKDLILRN
ncbi:MAG: MmgE/PrpD family protein [Candidatus Hodarchaeales archaeon]|jgi:2-methylcitrate dehydratase PrpD